MTILRRIFFAAAAGMAVLTSCSVDGPELKMEQDENMPQMSADVVSGQLLVRFDEGVSEVLDAAGLITKSGDAPAGRTGAALSGRPRREASAPF